MKKCWMLGFAKERGRVGVPMWTMKRKGKYGNVPNLENLVTISAHFKRMSGPPASLPPPHSPGFDPVKE